MADDRMKIQAELSEKEQAVLIYCKEYHKMNDNLPTRREIAEFTDSSGPAPIQRRIESLVNKGYLEYIGGGRIRFARN